MVFGGIAIPFATTWKHSEEFENSINTVKYQAVGIEFVSIYNAVKHPRQLMATI